MNNTAGPAISAELLVAYLDGEVNDTESRAVEQAIAESTTLRKELETLRQIQRALAQPSPEFARIDLAARVNRAIEREPEAHNAPWSGFVRSVPWLAAATLLLVGGAAFHQRLRGSGPITGPATSVLAPSASDWYAEPSQFRAKGGDTSQGQRDQWVGIRVYRQTGNQTPHPLGETLTRGDAVLFSYANGGPRPYQYLMLLAVDARNRVFWFYPPYEREGTNPGSIAMQKDVQSTELGEAIRHEFATGPLKLRALFSDTPLQVLDVESWLARNPPPNASLPWADVSEQTITTTVVERGGGSPL